MPISSAAKIAAIAVAALCLVVSACNRKGEETTASGSEYSGQFASGNSDSDLGSSAPSQVANAQLPEMAPAYSASGS